MSERDTTPLCGYEFDSTLCVAFPGHAGPHVTSNERFPHGLLRGVAAAAVAPEPSGFDVLRTAAWAVWRTASVGSEAWTILGKAIAEADALRGVPAASVAPDWLTKLRRQFEKYRVPDGGVANVPDDCVVVLRATVEKLLDAAARGVSVQDGREPSRTFSVGEITGALRAALVESFSLEGVGFDSGNDFAGYRKFWETLGMEGSHPVVIREPETVIVDDADDALSPERAGLEAVLRAVMQRLESHGAPDMPCRLDARDRSALAQGKRALQEEQPSAAVLMFNDVLDNLER